MKRHTIATQRAIAALERKIDMEKEDYDRAHVTDNHWRIHHGVKRDRDTGASWQAFCQRIAPFVAKIRELEG